jgi:hypothetical protein
MNRRLAHLLVRLYPQDWRERYGVEFEEFLEEGKGGLRASVNTFFNVMWSALCEHLSPKRGDSMNHSSSFADILKQPSAFLPLAMSFTALALVLGSIAMFGVVHEADEGVVAHLWQTLMAGQMPLLAFFAIKWLPRAPRQTLSVLGLQAGAALASIAPVFFLHL